MTYMFILKCALKLVLKNIRQEISASFTSSSLYVCQHSCRPRTPITGHTHTHTHTHTLTVILPQNSPPTPFPPFHLLLQFVVRLPAYHPLCSGFNKLFLRKIVVCVLRRTSILSDGRHSFCDRQVLVTVRSSAVLLLNERAFFILVFQVRQPRCIFNNQ